MGLILCMRSGVRGMGCEVKWSDYKMFTLAQHPALICRGAKQEGCMVKLSSKAVAFLGQSVSCTLFLVKVVENIRFSFQFT